MLKWRRRESRHLDTGRSVYTLSKTAIPSFSGAGEREQHGFADAPGAAGLKVQRDAAAGLQELLPGGGRRRKHLQQPAEVAGPAGTAQPPAGAGGEAPGAARRRAGQDHRHAEMTAAGDRLNNPSTY